METVSRPILQLAEEMAEKLDGKSFEIIRKTTDEGTLYASVNSAAISDELKKQGISIVGVSQDSEESHKKFSTKYSLPFPLISDKEKKIFKKAKLSSKNRH